MTIYKTECPFCGAAIKVDNPRKHFTCSYCGSNLRLNIKENELPPPIDELALKRAETERIVRINRIKAAEAQYKTDNESRQYAIKISIILGIIGSLLFILGFIAGDLSGNPDSPFYIISMLGFACLLCIVVIWARLLTKKSSSYTDCEKIEIPYPLDNLDKKNIELSKKTSNPLVLLILNVNP